MNSPPLRETDPQCDQEPPERRHQISLANDAAADVDEELIKRAILWALDDTPYDEARVSVAIVDDSTIHELNRKFLAHDYPTDVLSFALEDDPPRLEGEIIASVDTARQNALEAGWSTHDELLLYVVHGALHLAGYLDKSPQDAAEMRSAEAAVLQKLGISPSPRDARWAGSGDDAADEEGPRT
jgi:probable rRNA maturation factor